MHPLIEATRGFANFIAAPEPPRCDKISHIMGAYSRPIDQQLVALQHKDSGAADVRSDRKVVGISYL
jgi:hypothetical protein